MHNWYKECNYPDKINNQIDVFDNSDTTNWSESACRCNLYNNVEAILFFPLAMA